MVDWLSSLAKRVAPVVPQNHFGDWLYSSMVFAKYHGRLPNLRRPRLFNEHMLRLKLSSSALDPLRQFVTDKEHVKQYVESTVGKAYNVPILAVLRDPHAARTFAYPVPCIVKPTHLSAECILRRTPADVVDPSVLARWFRTRYYPLKREPNYRYLVPKVIVERFLECDGPTGPSDYKFFCFFGKAQFVQVDYDRFGRHRRRIYSRDWTALPFTMTVGLAPVRDAPANYDEMLRIADQLAAPFEFMRVDLYSDGGRVYAGELTSYPGNCASPFIPFVYNEILAPLFLNRDADVLDLVHRAGPDVPRLPDASDSTEHSGP